MCECVRYNDEDDMEDRYNSAALLGSGRVRSNLMRKRVQKGSMEAKMKMAYLRSLRAGKRSMRGGIELNPFKLIENGVKYCETGPELETNKNIHSMWRNFDDVRQHKRRRCWIKEI